MTLNSLASTYLATKQAIDEHIKCDIKYSKCVGGLVVVVAVVEVVVFTDARLLYLCKNKQSKNVNYHKKGSLCYIVNSSFMAIMVQEINFLLLERRLVYDK